MTNIKKANELKEKHRWHFDKFRLGISKSYHKKKFLECEAKAKAKLEGLGCGVDCTQNRAVATEPDFCGDGGRYCDEHQEEKEIYEEILK